MFFTIPNFLERMLEDPLSPLTVLSISAIITTVSLFFCGIPICLQIFRRGSTHEISGFPFLMGFLGGAFWLRYGLLKLDLTMVSVNAVGVSLMALYTLFYLFFSRPRTCFLTKMAIVGLTISAMLVLVHIYQLHSLSALGFVCMTFNIINFGAPLAGLTVVLRNRSCATLPLPLCVANLLVSTQWCVYGVCVNDIFIIIPNGVGVLLAALQIALFLVFPHRPGTKAPLYKCLCCLDKLESGIGERAKREIAQSRALLQAQRGRLLHRQRIIDRRMIPQSRAACIAFLRAGAFDASGGSVSSRSTTDSWMANSLSRVSSRSHPELWPPPIEVAELEGGSDTLLYGIGSTVYLPQNGPSTPVGPSPNTLIIVPVANGQPARLYNLDRNPEVDEFDERDPIIRALSAPDLAQQQILTID